MMTESEAISQSFYDQLGPDGLSARTQPDWDQKIVASLTKMIRPGSKILDVGCGYGRIAVSLARHGFSVTGLDLSNVLLAKAKEMAEATGLRVEWLHESMCEMSTPSDSFDTVLSLWSAFYELLSERDQLKAIQEMYRVLKLGGWALIEGPTYRKATEEELSSGRRYGLDGRIAFDVINGLTNPHFLHDSESFGRLMALANISTYQVYVADWAGRDRQFLQFEK